MLSKQDLKNLLSWAKHLSKCENFIYNRVDSKLSIKLLHLIKDYEKKYYQDRKAKKENQNDVTHANQNALGFQKPLCKKGNVHATSDYHAN